MFRSYRTGYLALLLCVEVLFATALWFGKTPVVAYVRLTFDQMLVFWLIPGVVWLVVVFIKSMRRFDGRSFRRYLRFVRQHRLRLLRGTVFAIVALPMVRAFGGFKTSLQTHTTFQADQPLADFERGLLGADAWQWTHAIFGPYGTLLIDRMYYLWFPVTMLMVGWMMFTRNQRFQVHGLLSLVTSFLILGMGVAYLLASAGPCFYDQLHGGDRFAPLLANLREANEIAPVYALIAMDWLVSRLGVENFGTGITAMPSMHVSSAVLFALVVRSRFGPGWRTRASCLYVSLIWLGSVHLGWHYALDGLVSWISTVAIWAGIGKLLDRSESGLRPIAVPAASAA